MIRDREGQFDIMVFRNGRLYQHDVVKNLVTNSALNKEIEILLGVAPDLQIKYMAFGTGSTAPSGTDVKLVSEQLRIPPTTAFSRTATGETNGGFFLTSTDLVGVTIEEVGIYCGSTATATVDTGTLLSRALWHFEKTANDEISITRIDKVIRA